MEIGTHKDRIFVNWDGAHLPIYIYNKGMTSFQLAKLSDIIEVRALLSTFGSKLT